MTLEIERLLEKCSLARLKPFLEKHLLSGVAFDLNRTENPNRGGASRFGGEPDLPKNFAWSENKGRPLDFLLQINLSEVAAFDKSDLLPKEGLLSFFTMRKMSLGGTTQAI